MDETTTTPPVPTVEPLQAAAEKSPGPSVRVPVWLVAGLLGFSLGAGATGLAWALSSGDSTTTAAPTAETFTLTGSMLLANGASSGTAASGCAGLRGYDDIAKGTSVTVYDESGKVLATGALGSGSPKGVDGCMFPVAVHAVPKGPKFYQVEVGHRGKATLQKEEAEAGLLAVQLG
ncbi:hypothetical protein [Kitasatospora sp. NPDC059327]|uniref:hypothetical protein n=1 Tax=Kitasatospora sp. NPDC059327 TaxID=3346803 RepID=UPI003677E170